MRPEEIVDLWFGPGPFRDIVENWPEVVRAGVASLRREASRTFDPQLVELLGRAEDHVRRIENTEYHAEADAPTICPRLRIDGHTIRTISTAMRFDTAGDVTASELRIELLFPADEESDAALRDVIARSTQTAPNAIWSTDLGLPDRESSPINR